MTTSIGEMRAAPAAGAGSRVIRLGMADIAGQVRLKSQGGTMVHHRTSAHGGSGRAREASGGYMVLSTRQILIGAASLIAIVASLGFMVARATGRDSRNAEAIMASRALVCQACKGVYKIGQDPAPNQLPRDLKPQGGGGYTGICDLCGKTDATFLMEYRSDKAK